MKLIKDLEDLVEQETSPVQKQLLSEDINRLNKIWEMSATNFDQQAFLKAGLFIGWTNGDLRTAELKEPIENLLSTIFKLRQEGSSEENDSQVRDAWIKFIHMRMEKLVHCL